MIVGIDEVGRGAWAGPLVVGAVVLGGVEIEGLTDSKKLTPKKRILLAREIKAQAAGIGLGWVSAAIIDRIGLSQALTLATQRALRDITIEYEQIIIDGTVNFIDDPRVTTMKQADLFVPSVSAASIMAKVARDYYMSEVVTKTHPEYGFEKHVGYGTALHRNMLEKYGVSHMHRFSVAPVRSLLGDVAPMVVGQQKITKTKGRQAEKIAAEFLQNTGYSIVELNWRTKLCEIDIVAKKGDVMYLVEVKYRENDTYGNGMSAITPRKLRQMQFAARIWQYAHHYTDDMQLAAISLHGSEPKVIEYTTDIL